MAVQAPAEHAPAHHNPLVLNRIGLWLFFFSESVIFGLLLSSRFFLEGIHQEHVDQQLGLVITIVLLLSSVKNKIPKNKTRVKSTTGNIS